MMIKTKLLLLSVICGLASIALSAEKVHLTVIGEDQGWIKGDSSVITLGREDTIEAVSYTHMLYSEPDSEGIAGKVRNHFPVSILKLLDKSTPRLFLAWRNNESLDITIRFYRPSPAGATVHFYTVILTDAYISGIRQEVRNSLIQDYPPLERISFTYKFLELIWEDGGIQYGDEWHANTSRIPFSDVNFDGIVNMADYAILADDWLTQY